LPEHAFLIHVGFLLSIHVVQLVFRGLGHYHFRFKRNVAAVTYQIEGIWQRQKLVDSMRTGKGLAGSTLLGVPAVDERRVQPKTVQTFAGHSSLQVTMDRYGHLFRSDSHGRTMDIIAEAIDATVRTGPVPNVHRKWWEFVP
jgi:integrase